MAGALGVPAVRVSTTGEYRRALADAIAERGPRLVEVMVAARRA